MIEVAYNASPMSNSTDLFRGTNDIFLCQFIERELNLPPEENLAKRVKELNWINKTNKELINAIKKFKKCFDMPCSIEIAEVYGDTYAIEIFEIKDDDEPKFQARVVTPSDVLARYIWSHI